LALEIDPDWNNGQQYVYIYYGSTKQDGKAAGMRLSRFKHYEYRSGLQPDSLDARAEFSEEQLLWHDTDGWGVSPQWHYGGSLQFGPDKKLYLTLGDKYTERMQTSNKHHSGCIIRINRDGTIPSGNLPAKTKPKACWAHGIRNGFSSHWDLPTNRFFIAEVGGNNKCKSMEDIHLGKQGVDYGWPYCEGKCDNPDFPQCDCKKHDNPIWTYDRENCNNAAIVGGTIVRNKMWPDEYYGAYFYGDFSKGTIDFLTFESDGSETVQKSTRLGNIQSPIAIDQDLEGNLWVTAYRGRRGYFYKITRANGGNVPPVINMAMASKAGGPLPLEVQFAALATDPERAKITYEWSFGDGAISDVASTVHTFTEAGEYTVQLYASDGKSTSISKEITIVAGVVPEASIISPANGYKFKAGEVIELIGAGAYTNGAGDKTLLPSDSLQWVMGFIHSKHVHPIGTDPIGAMQTYTIPTSGHGFDDTTGLRFDLIATSHDGLQTVESVEIWPDFTSLHFGSEPSGLKVLVDHSEHTTPFDIQSVANFEHVIELAVVEECVGGLVHTPRFAGPHNAATHITTTPESPEPVMITWVGDASRPCILGPVYEVYGNGYCRHVRGGAPFAKELRPNLEKCMQWCGDAGSACTGVEFYKINGNKGWCEQHNQEFTSVKNNKKASCWTKVSDAPFMELPALPPPPAAAIVKVAPTPALTTAPPAPVPSWLVISSPTEPASVSAPPTPAPASTEPESESEPAPWLVTKAPTEAARTPAPAPQALPPGYTLIGSTGACSFENLVDLNGFDISGKWQGSNGETFKNGYRTASATGCATGCMANPSCNFYTFMNKRCYFKTSDAGRQSTTNKKAVSGGCIRITASPPPPQPLSVVPEEAAAAAVAAAFAAAEA
jgi:PKD repeat protein